MNQSELEKFGIPDPDAKGKVLPEQFDSMEILQKLSALTGKFAHHLSGTNGYLRLNELEQLEQKWAKEGGSAKARPKIPATVSKKSQFPDS